MTRHIVVVGGGPAGMLAAASAAAGAQVTLVEKNEKLGKKLYITGKGRCNLTNIAPMYEFFPQIVTNPRFMHSAFARFSNRDLMALIERLGVPLKTERGGRVFPVSDKSSDVLHALERHLHAKNVNVLLNTRVREILQHAKTVAGVMTSAGPLEADAVILATGGAAYPATGSTGEGYAFLRALGHMVEPIRPSLVPLITEEYWPAALAGLTLKNVVLSGSQGTRRVFRDLGELLFTHTGVSGPLALAASAYIEPSIPCQLTIDLKPGLNEEQLDARITRELQAHNNQQAIHALGTLLPKKLMETVLMLAKIEGTTPAHALTRVQRRMLGQTLKKVSLNVKSLGSFDEAIVTHGGANVKQIDAKTMRSKCIDRLYVCGELLDVDAQTGGYNLQVAFSTGYLAGVCAAEEVCALQ